MRRHSALAIVAGCLLSGSALHGQGTAPATFRVLGTVTALGGDALSEAEVSLTTPDGVQRLTHTDSSGHFTIGGLPVSTGTLRVRHFGFEAKSIAVSITRADHSGTYVVQLEPAVRRLDAIETTADSGEMEDPRLRAFEERAESNSFGHFVRPARIAQLHPTFTSDALRGLPGVQLRPGRRFGNEVRIRGCSPLVWVDGVRTPGAELDDVTHTDDVAAIEVYNSLAGVPAQFSDRTATCGTILVWLKPRI